MYAVKFAQDELMPKGEDWVICRDKSTNNIALYIRASARKWSDADMGEVLASAWAGYVRLAEGGEQVRPCAV